MKTLEDYKICWDLIPSGRNISVLGVVRACLTRHIADMAADLRTMDHMIKVGVLYEKVYNDVDSLSVKDLGLLGDIVAEKFVDDTTVETSEFQSLFYLQALKNQMYYLDLCTVESWFVSLGEDGIWMPCVAETFKRRGWVCEDRGKKINSLIDLGVIHHWGGSRLVHHSFGRVGVSA